MTDPTNIPEHDPRWRDEDMPLRSGDVLAVGLDNGRCPVGMVAAVNDHYLRLDLYSWLTREFGAGTAVVGHGQVRGLSNLAVQDGDGVYLMEPLRQFQIAWTENRP
jgi:hypothetical protein